jgi:hypothetical protein
MIIFLKNQISRTNLHSHLPTLLPHPHHPFRPLLSPQTGNQLPSDREWKMFKIYGLHQKGIQDGFGTSGSVRKRKMWRNKDKYVDQMPECIEMNLILMHGSFRKGRSEENT